MNEFERMLSQNADIVLGEKMPISMSYGFLKSKKSDLIQLSVKVPSEFF